MSTVFKRALSNSPYGRAHVWKRRKPKLPNPVVPLFPQKVFLADGSSYTHWTTSPKSQIGLTRDLTNHPLWKFHQASATASKGKDGLANLDGEEESAHLSKYREKFKSVPEGSNWSSMVQDTPASDQKPSESEEQKS